MKLTVLCAVVLFTPVVQATVVEYHQNFEESGGGYSKHPQSEENSWEYGTPGTQTQANKLWGTALDAPYYAGEISAIRSPEIDLSGMGEDRVCYLGWWQTVDIEARHDSIAIEVSGDGGVSWQLAYSKTHGFPDGWHFVRCRLPDDVYTAATRLQFRLNSDETHQQDGWFVDDIMIVSVPVHDEIYQESFEDDNGQFTVAGTGATWEWGECSNSQRNYYPTGAAHGEKLWGTNLDGVHEYLENSTLTSPDIALPGQHAERDLLISWDQYLLLAEAQFTVELKNGDEPWQPIYESETSYASKHWDWHYAVFPAETMGEQLGVRFHFHVLDDWYVHGGAYVDNLEVLVIPRIHVDPNANEMLEVEQAGHVNLGGALAATDAHECIAVQFEHQPSHGTITWREETVTAEEPIPVWKIKNLVYHPEPTFVGQDEVLWREQDFFGGWSEPAALGATVQDREAPPVVKQTDYKTVFEEDSGVNSVDLTDVFLDPDNPDSVADVEFSIMENTCASFADIQLTDGTVQCTPLPNRAGSGFLNIRAQLNGAQVTAKLSFEVQAVNDPPRLEGTRMVFDPENRQLHVNMGTWYDPDEEGPEQRTCRYEWVVDGQTVPDETTTDLALADFPYAAELACCVTPWDAYESGAQVTVCALVYFLEEGWNLLGLPIIADNAQAIQKLSSKAVGNLYTWQNGRYRILEDAEAGSSFWLFASAAESVVIAGKPVVMDTELKAGWHLLSVPLHASGRGAAWERLNRFWTWNSVLKIYARPPYLESTQAYWARGDEDGARRSPKQWLPSVNR